jgi:sigma-54 specific flagellar transcriptional regulator A
MRAVLEFIDHRPVIVSDFSELDLAQCRQQDWLAVVIGRCEQEAATRFIEWFKRDRMHPPILVMQPYYEQAIERFALDRSACLMLETPVRYTQLSEQLRRASLLHMEQCVRPVRLSGPSGHSAAVRRVRRMVEQVAGFDTTVLITGESGTGKEVVARAVHEQSARCDKPFVAVNCGAIPQELLESELFGHEKGAFTGAITARRGRFEMADGGTLFLDEIGDMPLQMQVKILRVLQERSYERVGSNRSTPCDVRIIAATHRNLEDAIIKGSFREDLYYRLNVFPIEMPPLRERIDDLPLLIEDLIHMLDKSGHGHVRLAPEAVHMLRGYHWPGNVRELSNLIERLAVLHPHALIGVAELPVRYRSQTVTEPQATAEPPVGPARSAAIVPLSMAMTADEVPAAVALPRPRAADELPPEGVNLKDHIEGIELASGLAAGRWRGGACGEAAEHAPHHPGRETAQVRAQPRSGG